MLRNSSVLNVQKYFCNIELMLFCRIAKFTSQVATLEKEMKDQEEKYAGLIRTLLDAYKKFEAEVKEEMDRKLKPAFDKLYKD